MHKKRLQIIDKRGENKRSSLRSQCCKMRLLEWFSNTVMSPRLSIATLAILWLVSTVHRTVMSIFCLSAFSRFLPKNPHPMTVYVRPGVEVDKNRSNEKRVTLRNLQHKTTGRYRCEVSTEGPTFATESKYGDLLVVGKIDDTLFENAAKSLIFKTIRAKRVPLK